jgi:polyhydroxybutyrate depolymerase
MSPRMTIRALLAAATAAGFLSSACGKDEPVQASQTSQTSSGGSSSGDAASSSSGGNTLQCGVAETASGFRDKLTLDLAGVKRTYAIGIPEGYDGRKSYPVIVAFHGDGGTGLSAQASFKFEAAHATEAIFVYPDGLNKAWDLDTWDSSKNKDVLFIDALVAEVKRTSCAGNFFATGFSRGGFFANHLGCHRGEVFSAVAAHGGGGPYDGSNSHYDANGNIICETKALPTLHVIGQSDSLFKDAQYSRKYWTFANGCGPQVTPSQPSPCESSVGCTKPLEWCAIPGMGHQVWAQGAEKTWGFFKPLF